MKVLVKIGKRLVEAEGIACGDGDTIEVREGKAKGFHTGRGKKWIRKDDIDDIIAQYAGVMKSLSESLMCPGCKKVVKPPFFNLGIDYNWAEGCADCHKKEAEK